MIRVTIEIVPNGQEEWAVVLDKISIVNIHKREDNFADYLVQRDNDEAMPGSKVIRFWDREQSLTDLVIESLRRLPSM
jgi:hypothetical protein